MEMGERKGGGREDFAKERERVVIFDLRPRATTLTPSPRTSKLPFEGTGIDGGEDDERRERRGFEKRFSPPFRVFRDSFAVDRGNFMAPSDWGREVRRWRRVGEMERMRF